MQPVAQIGIRGLRHTRAGGGLFFLYSGFCGQALINVLLHPAQPALGVGEHAIGFQNLQLLFITAFGPGQKLFDTDA